MSVARVSSNRDLLTYILSFVDSVELKKLVPHLRNRVHYDYINPTIHTLVYGEVQSGKTRKIMEYVQRYRRDLPKIVVIQNNLFMLNQYIKSLEQSRISYKVLSNTSCKHEYNQEQVLLIINNKFRMSAMGKYMSTNKYSLKSYCLVLDEADQYIKKIQNSVIYKNAINVLHVTATPFRYKRILDFDSVVKLKPNRNYIGINDICIKETFVDKFPEASYVQRLRDRICAIIDDDFMKRPEGVMLINCFRFVVEMKHEARRLSETYADTTVIVLSSNIHLFLNGEDYSTRKNTNLQTLFDGLKGRVILIANRLSNRGVNYTNSDYTKYITHQISMATSNHTSFIQKCRIFGIRPTKSNPILYCILNDTKHMLFVNKLKRRVANVSQAEYVIEEVPKPKKITVRELKRVCKEHNIKRYSKLRKHELVHLLQERNIEIPYR